MKKYRQNVGIIVLNKKNNKIFAGHRIDIPKDAKNGWQMPQGGIEENENIKEAGLRELLEETGITADKVDFIAAMPESIKYDFPPNYVSRRGFENFRGQEQHWIVFVFLGKNTDINLKATNEKQEFCEWKWETTNFLINNVVDFKKETYKKVFQWMKDSNIY